MDSVSRLGWAASSTFLVGDLHLGVRSNSLATDELVRNVLAPCWVPGVEAPPNYSVWIEAPTQGEHSSPATALHRLYRSSGLVVRSRDSRRVIDGLVSYLSTHADPHDGLLPSVNAALVGHDRAILLPNQLLGSLELLQPRLERKGWRFVDSFVTAIDPDTAELVVRPNLLPVDWAVIDGLDGRSHRGIDAVPAGRYPIARWIFFPQPGINGSASKAAAVAAAMGTVAKDALGPQASLRAVARVFTRATACSVTSADRKTTVSEIVRIATEVAA